MKHLAVLPLTVLAAVSLTAYAPPSKNHAGIGVPAERHLPARAAEKSASTQLKHIVVIIQENRSLDNLFNGFCLPSGPCADTVTVDPVTGKALAPQSMTAPFDPNHDHSTFVTEYDYGKMDGFAQTHVVCSKGVNPCPYDVFDYVPASETPIYRQLATVDGVLADETLATDNASSFPSHIYAIAGQSGGYDSDHDAIVGGSGSCGTKKNVKQIDMSTPFPGQNGPQAKPCKDFQTIMDLLTSAGHSWRYYSDSPAGFWSATQVIQHLYNSPNFIVPSTQVVTDVKNGVLADVTFVMPWAQSVSDHPGKIKDPLAGQRWVASVVNAIGESAFWQDTAIVVWWDEWGGFYDHVTPPIPRNPLEYGFRIPLIVASSYARVGTIDHTQRTFASALRLIEKTFNLPSLGTADQYEPDGLDAAFDFKQTPIPYTPLGGSRARPLKHPSH